MLHSITLLNEVVDDQLEIDIVDFLSRCQDPNGGYGGGPGQMPHLATTYAAVNSLITIGGERALSSINRKNLLKQNLYSFLLQMKDLSGGFRLHYGGELDVRACYTTISVSPQSSYLVFKMASDCELNMSTSQVFWAYKFF
ncbi:hypothetical protein Leryth_006874 [Lithospermum erythrorhizon]|nr:hypothetical protein Leryth_006874 [Lithospermum erythrorhizon]